MAEPLQVEDSELIPLIWQGLEFTSINPDHTQLVYVVGIWEQHEKFQ